MKTKAQDKHQQWWTKKWGVVGKHFFLLGYLFLMEERLSSKSAVVFEMLEAVYWSASWSCATYVELLCSRCCWNQFHCVIEHTHFHKKVIETSPFTEFCLNFVFLFNGQPLYSVTLSGISLSSLTANAKSTFVCIWCGMAFFGKLKYLEVDESSNLPKTQVLL